MKRDQPKGSSISAGWHGSPSLSKHSSLFKRCKRCLPLALICVLVYTDRDYILGVLRIRRLLPAVGIILKYSKGSESVPLMPKLRRPAALKTLAFAKYKKTEDTSGTPAVSSTRVVEGGVLFVTGESILKSITTST